MARFLGPEETGLFKSFTIPLTYMTFLHLGTFDGLWRQIPYYLEKKNYLKVDNLAATAGYWNLIVSITVSLIFFLIAVYSLIAKDVYGFFGWISQSICCWGVFYGGYLGATYRTLSHFVVLAKINLIQSVLNFLMVFLLPFFKFYGLCFRSFFPVIVGLLLCHIKKPLNVKYLFNVKEFQEIVKVGLPFSFWGSLYTSIWFAVESTLMLYFGGLTGLGYFSVAVAMREGMNVLPMAVYQVLSPKIVAAFSRDGNINSSITYCFKITIFLVCFMSVSVFFVSLFIELIVPLAIPKYIHGLDLMKLCLLFSVVQSASIPSNLLFAENNHYSFGKGIFIGLLIFLIMSLIFVNFMSPIIGIALASLLGRSARVLSVYYELYLINKSNKL